MSGSWRWFDRRRTRRGAGRCGHLAGRGRDPVCRGVRALESHPRRCAYLGAGQRGRRARPASVLVLADSVTAADARAMLYRREPDACTTERWFRGCLDRRAGGLRRAQHLPLHRSPGEHPAAHRREARRTRGVQRGRGGRRPTAGRHLVFAAAEAPRVVTPLMPPYEEAVLARTGARDLDGAWERARSGVSLRLTRRGRIVSCPRCTRLRVSADLLRWRRRRRRWIRRSGSGVDLQRNRNVLVFAEDPRPARRGHSSTWFRRNRVYLVTKQSYSNAHNRCSAVSDQNFPLATRTPAGPLRPRRTRTHAP